MARNVLKTVEKNFVKGRLSEFTGLNFPENSCYDENNCVFDSKGLVTRRPGFDGEEGFDYVDLDEEGAVSRFVWKNAGKSADKNYVVVQQGDEIGFFPVSAAGTLSTGGLFYTLTISDYGTNSDARLRTCSYAQGNGRLFISNPLMETVSVEIDSSGAVTVTPITIQVRDTEGLEDAALDNEPADTRPGTLSGIHEYNLYNQGWWKRNVYGSNGSLRPPLDHWKKYQSVYPSNADIWWRMKFIASNGREEFTPKDKVIAINEPLGNAPAPKGHFIISAFDQNRETLSDVSGLQRVTSFGQRASIVAFFAGRVWYAGVNCSGFAQNVYFSKIIEGRGDYGKCYQVNDPTIEEGTDLLDSDGGTLRILEMGTPIAFFNMKESLLIFATNGIWAISGSTGTGFKATDYSVNKISGVGALSPLSIVNVEGSPAWWNADGIYSLTSSQAGTIEAQSLTKPSIQGYYNDINVYCKRFAMGDYNPVEKRVIWLFNLDMEDFITSIPDSSDFSVNYSAAYTYTKALILDVATGAFYTWTFEPGDICDIRGVLCVDSQGAHEQTEDVTVLGVVVTETGQGVFVDTIIILDTSSAWKYIVRKSGSGLTFGEVESDTFKDFVNLDYSDFEGVAYQSYFDTGFKIHADGDKMFQSHWITVFSQECYNGNSEESQATVQGRWDWALDSSTGKFGTAQQCVPSASNDTAFARNTMRRRLKMRGSGPSLQLHFSSVAQRPFRISGWSTFETAADTPSR